VADELLVSLDEAARRLAMSRRSVQNLTYSGALPALAIGRSRRIAVADLERFVEQLRQDTSQPLAVVDGRRR
jgi:excisionase family DNA binding protein